MERNVVKMIDLTQFMFIESTGDSESKSDLDTGSFSRCHRKFLSEFDDDDDDDDDDDAESCSYGSSHGGYVDGLCHDYDYRDKKKNVHQNNDDDDGTSYNDNRDDDDDGTSYNDNRDDDDDDDDDAIDSKMVEVSKKCGAWQEKRDCSFLNEKENDKNFWETCLAS